MAVQRQTGHQMDAKESAVDLTGMEYRFAARAADGRFQLPLLGGKVAGVIQEGKVAGKHSTVATGNQLKVLAGAVLAVGDQVAAMADGRAKVAVAGQEILGEVIAPAAVGELAEVDFSKKGLFV
jgi:hypothetical protein